MQRLFGKHLEKFPPLRSEVYELKFTKHTSLPFDSVKEHQIKGLKQAEEKGIYHKIQDMPWGTTDKFRFTLKKPFDCFFVRATAFVVIWYYVPRATKRFTK